MDSTPTAAGVGPIFIVHLGDDIAAAADPFDLIIDGLAAADWDDISTDVAHRVFVRDLGDGRHERLMFLAVTSP
jgi:hypothetical protein